MKRLSLIIGLLLLTGCTAHAQVSSWGTHYVTNNAKVTQIETTLRDCAQKAIDTNYYGLDRTRVEIQGCYEAYTGSSTVHGTDTYYFWTGQEKDGDSPYQDFSVCIFQRSMGPWEFGPDDTTYTYRAQIRQCLALFPAKY
jgi:hypothetical protein